MSDLKIQPAVGIERPALAVAKARRAFYLILVVTVAITAVRYYTKAEKPSRTGELTRTAFLRWRPQIHALDAGTPVFTSTVVSASVWSMIR